MLPKLFQVAADYDPDDLVRAVSYSRQRKMQRYNYLICLQSLTEQSLVLRTSFFDH